MSVIFTDFLRTQLTADQTVMNGKTLKMVLFHGAPAFSNNDPRYVTANTVALLKARLGWEEVTATGYPLTNTRVVSTRVETLSTYVMLSDFLLDTALIPVSVRAIGIYLSGTLGGVTNPLLMVTNTPLAPSMILRGGDLLAPRSDSTLSGVNNKWLFGWAHAAPGSSLSEGPLSIQKMAPDFEPSHVQHVWLYPQRVNFIANPSFEGGVNHWRSNGTASQATITEFEDTHAGQFTKAAGVPLVVESNKFPALSSQWTVQLLVKGTGTLRVGMVSWPIEYNETVVDWGADNETWDLTTGASFVHVQALRQAAQPYEAQLRLETTGTLMVINKVMVENGFLLDWPYFDGDTRYSAREDYSWYGGASLAGQTYSLWYNNKRATGGRLFATNFVDRAALTSAQELQDGLVYKWVPAGVLVEPHWGVLYKHDLISRVADVAGQAVTPYKTAPPATAAWAADLGVRDPWVPISG